MGLFSFEVVTLGPLGSHHLQIRKTNIEKPRLVGIFPNTLLANRFKRQLEMGRRELADIWSEAPEEA